MTMLLFWGFLVLCALSDVHGETVRIDWTPVGVAHYRDPSNPLRTEAGDILILICDQVSNLFIQEERIQHEECNASAGSGQYDYNGFCPANGELMLTLTVNSQNLMNTFNFENNRLYYFASYSNGLLGDANNRSINSGGQCEDGLKMVVLIGEIPTPDVGGNQPGGSGDSGGSGGLPIAIIAGAGGGAAVIILIVFLCICICICLRCCNRNKVANKPSKNGSSVNPPENPKEPKVVGSSPIVNGKVKEDYPAENNMPGEGPAAMPKMAASAKANGRNMVDTMQTQSGSPKGTRNATNNSTQNKTGAASSPSLINKASRSDNKTTVNNGHTNHKGTVRSTTGSSVAAIGHNRPAPPPPKAPMKHERVQGKPAAPTQSLPPPSIAAKHERLQGKPAPTQSLPPPSTAAKHDGVKGNLPLRPSVEIGRTQKNKDRALYKTKNGAINL